MSWNFRKNKAVLMISHDIWTAPVITSWNFGKKKNIFVDITWKFELPLLSRVDNFTKTRQLSSSDFKNWIDYYH